MASRSVSAALPRRVSGLPFGFPGVSDDRRYGSSSRMRASASCRPSALTLPSSSKMSASSTSPSAMAALMLLTRPSGSTNLHHLVAADLDAARREARGLDLEAGGAALLLELRQRLRLPAAVCLLERLLLVRLVAVLEVLEALLEVLARLALLLQRRLVLARLRLPVVVGLDLVVIGIRVVLRRIVRRRVRDGGRVVLRPRDAGIEAQELVERQQRRGGASGQASTFSDTLPAARARSLSAHAMLRTRSSRRSPSMPSASRCGGSGHSALLGGLCGAVRRRFSAARAPR
jgi:hypothetical protein